MATKDWKKKPKKDVWWNKSKLQMLTINFKRNIKRYIISVNKPQKNILLTTRETLQEARKVASNYMEKY